MNNRTFRFEEPQERATPKTFIIQDPQESVIPKTFIIQDSQESVIPKTFIIQDSQESVIPKTFIIQDSQENIQQQKNKSAIDFDKTEEEPKPINENDPYFIMLENRLKIISESINNKIKNNTFEEAREIIEKFCDEMNEPDRNGSFTEMQVVFKKDPYFTHKIVKQLQNIDNEKRKSYKRFYNEGEAFFKEAQNKTDENIKDGILNNALESFKKYESFEQNDINVYIGIANVYSIKGNIGGAIASITKAKLLKPDSALIMYNTSRIYLEGYNKENKIDYIEESLSFIEKAINLEQIDEYKKIKDIIITKFNNYLSDKYKEDYTEIVKSISSAKTSDDLIGLKTAKQILINFKNFCSDGYKAEYYKLRIDNKIDNIPSINEINNLINTKEKEILENEVALMLNRSNNLSEKGDFKKALQMLQDLQCKLVQNIDNYIELDLKSYCMKFGLNLHSNIEEYMIIYQLKEVIHEIEIGLDSTSIETKLLEKLFAIKNQCLEILSDESKSTILAPIIQEIELKLQVKEEERMKEDMIKTFSSVDNFVLGDNYEAAEIGLSNFEKIITKRYNELPSFFEIKNKISQKKEFINSSKLNNSILENQNEIKSRLDSIKERVSDYSSYNTYFNDIESFSEKLNNFIDSNKTNPEIITMIKVKDSEFRKGIENKIKNEIDYETLEIKQKFKKYIQSKIKEIEVLEKSSFYTNLFNSSDNISISFNISNLNTNSGKLKQLPLELASLAGLTSSSIILNIQEIPIPENFSANIDSIGEAINKKIVEQTQISQYLMFKKINVEKYENIFDDINKEHFDKLIMSCSSIQKQIYETNYLPFLEFNPMDYYLNKTKYKSRIEVINKKQNNNENLINIEDFIIKCYFL
jgi:hypothetical protein